MQEVPGGQNTYAGTSYLWGDEKMQQLTIQLWETLSDRFRGRDEVAAYSLMAEPYGAPTTADRDAMYDRLVKAIRAKGDDHLLVIHDGFFGMGTLPKPSDMGWDGVVYSTHLFEWDLTDAAGYDGRINYYDLSYPDAQRTQDVPYYIGSFSTFVDKDWAYEGARKLVAWFTKRNYSWSLWTFKRIDDPISTDLWGYTTQWGLLGRMTSPFAVAERADCYLDDKETLAAKLAGYKGFVIGPNDTLLQILQGK